MNQTTSFLRHLSTQDFAAFGVDEVAYVKKARIAEHDVWAIHAADGSPLGVAEGLTEAFAAIKQHDMEPVSVH